VDATGSIQYGELVRVVECPGFDESSDQRGLASHAAPRDENGLPLPADNPRVNEETVSRRIRGEQLRVLLERHEQRG
jgi:hypothetical protein